MYLTLSCCVAACSYNGYLKYLKDFSFYLVVYGQSDFLTSSSSSAWPNSELVPDEDSSGLDYMLALSLQSDGESVAGGGDDNLWSGIWYHTTGKMPNTSQLTAPNNNYPNFTTGTSAVQDHDQTGKCWNRLDSVTSVYSVVILLMISNHLYRYHATLWVLRRTLSRRGPYFASGRRCDFLHAHVVDLLDFCQSFRLTCVDDLTEKRWHPGFKFSTYQMWMFSCSRAWLCSAYVPQWLVNKSNIPEQFVTFHNTDSICETACFTWKLKPGDTGKQCVVTLQRCEG